MFFILSKILHFLVTPIVWVFLLLILSLLIKKQKLKKRILTSAIIIFYLFSNAAVFRIVKKSYIPQPYKFEKTKEYSAGIILGGLCSYNEVYKRYFFSEAGDRLFQTLHLYKKGKIGKIIVSGGSGRLFINEQKEADVIKEYLLLVNKE